MPQMLPMNWILLYVTFTMTLMIVIMMNFYYYTIIVKTKNQMNLFNKINSNNWTW
uniref:ATP synthase F0 subunit 8 n=1 Tax=Molanna angustata TaxID=446450 RepID=A0A7G7CEJ7_9NEOP|nr:ATP synthase F0 subunit 8 [Molanna angustata]